MSTITIGTDGNKHAVKIDLNVLLKTRLLIQANSGGGKSWLLRRLAEQLFKHIPVIIIDPEGEFATLREKFGFVLVGKGGETPADPRSAALVAHKLLELRASAVCDLYEMKPSERHRWVALFVDAVTNAPKNLWRPTVFITDEVHTFCPQKGSGESEAREAMVGSATRWRKRRFCPIWATQRLAKVDKDASAEMLNRLIGPTFEDVDLKRAADLLSVAPENRRKFDSQMRTLEPGYFFALGRAICTERLLIKVGPVQTSHEIEESKYASAPPPTPEAIAKMLPKLADLPKQAEEKAKTEAELRTEIRSLRAQLRAQPVPSKVISADLGQRDVLIRKAVTEATREYSAAIAERDILVVHLLRGLRQVGEQASKMADTARLFANSSLPVKIKAIPWAKQISTAKIPAAQIQKGESTSARTFPTVRSDVPKNDGDVTGPEQRILDAIAWMESVGIERPEQTAVAFLAGYTYGGGGFNNPRGALKTKGMVEYHGGQIGLTESGRRAAHAPELPLTTEALHEYVLKVLPGPEQKLLKVLLEIYPGDISNEELAERSGYTPGSGGFNNPRGRLRTLGLVHYPKPGRVIAKDLLFVQ